MKIKALIELRTPPYPKGLPELDADMTIYQAYDKFLKSNYFHFLPVFLNDSYCGIIAFQKLAEEIIKAYRMERGERFQEHKLLVQKIKKSIKLLSKGANTDQTREIIKLQMEMLAIL